MSCISGQRFNPQRPTHVLLPLPESRFLEFDLLGESLSEHLLLFSELRVVKLLDLWLSELAGLHLGQSVLLVVALFSGGDEVEHVCSNQNCSELFEVTVLLILDYTGDQLSSV